jgi:hypothetical protein
MPRNNEVNRKRGVYKSLCCGIEIVLAEDEMFPDCPRHARLSTKWKLIKEGAEIPEASKTGPKKPAA